MTEKAENALKAFFSANIAMSLLIAGMLQYLWGLINTLQMVVLTSLFTRLEIPLNADSMMVMMLKLCSLEFISTEDIYAFLFDFRDTDSFGSIADEEGNLTSKWEEAGFEGSNFI